MALNLEPLISEESSLQEKIWWVMDLLSPKEKEIANLPLWEECHYSYFVRKHGRQQIPISDVLATMTKEAKIQFSHRPEDRIEGHKVQLITSYFDLMRITSNLDVCSAVRPDLVEGFLDGSHLRWMIISPSNEIVGVITFQYKKNRSYFRKRSFQGQAFDVYGLGKKHYYLDQMNSVEGSVFRKFIDKHGLEISQSLKS